MARAHITTDGLSTEARGVRQAAETAQAYTHACIHATVSAEKGGERDLEEVRERAERETWRG